MGLLSLPVVRAQHYARAFDIGLAGEALIRVCSLGEEYLSFHGIDRTE